MLNKQVSGIYNIGAADAVSRYEFAKELAKIFDYKKAKIISKSQRDIPGGDKRPPSLVLDNAKIKKLGFIPALIREELTKLR